MNRRAALKIIPAALFTAAGLFGFSRIFASQNNSNKLPNEQLDISTPMNTIDDLSSLEANPETVSTFRLSEADWKTLLTPEQFTVLRQEGTERPGSSPLDAEKRAGQFVCAGCGLALFDSSTKYDSRTGWPSFYQEIEGRLGTKTDFKIGLPRTEYHCKRCTGHQGHVFKDGPQPTGLRYCNNGLALNFIPANSVS